MILYYTYIFDIMNLFYQNVKANGSVLKISNMKLSHCLFMQLFIALAPRQSLKKQQRFPYLA